MTKTFKVKTENEFKRASTSKGNQEKWYINDSYLKSDMLGYESVSEVLSSLLGKHILELKKYNVTDYDFCHIKTETELKEGCFSIDFSEKGKYETISLYRVLEKNDMNFEKKYNSGKLNGKELLEYIIKNIKESIFIDIEEYLQLILLFDTLILNEDRHLNNINLLFELESGRISLAPIFDNGLSLLSDINDYSMNNDVITNIRKVKSRTLTSSFSKQNKLFNNEKKLTIDFDKFEKELNEIVPPFKAKEFERAKKVLLFILKCEEDKIWKRK